MIFEIISIGLAITAGIAATIAYIYRRGISQGIDTTCGKRIENKIDAMQKDGDKIHNELKSEMKKISSKVDKLVGSFDTFISLNRSK
jgi:preprotein translocase subunit SecF